MTKAFAIRLPGEALRDANHFFSWVISHMNVGMPHHAVKLNTAKMGDIFEAFAKDLQKNFDFDYQKAMAYAKNIEWTEEKHAIWKREQSLEIHVVKINEGQFALECKMVGPGIISDEGVDFGYMDFHKFFMNACYHQGSYIFNFQNVLVPLEEEVTPLEIFPSLDFQYEIPKEGESKNHKELNKELVEAIEAKVTLSSMSKADIQQALEDNLRAIFEFTGSALKPLRYTAYMVSNPCEEGTKNFVAVNVSFGKSYNFVLPPFLS